MSREGVFWGWGEAGAGPSLPDHAAGFLRSALGVEGAVVSRPVALEEVRLRAAGAAGRGARAARGDRGGGARARRRGGARRPLPRQVLPRPAAPARGRLRGRAGRRGGAGRRGRGPAGDLRVQRGGRRGRALRRRHERGRRPRAAARPLRRADLARPRAAGGAASRSTSARTPRGCAAGRGCRRPTTRSARHGFTLAHTPQSYEWATVGGCVATRSAGQSSTGHGRIEDNVVALRCATPVGELATLAVPGTAAGPSLKRLVIGSEGTLGVITSVGLRVFPLPAAQRFEGWFVHSFAEGADALRQLVQAGLAPDVARLSDEAETRMGQALGGGGGLKGQAGRALLRTRGYAERLPGDLRLGGRRRGDRAPPRPCDAVAEAGGRDAGGRGPGAQLARRPLRRPAPARRPARPRRAGRDAGDGDELVEPRGAEDRGDAGAREHAGRAARDVPRLPPLRDRRLALLHRAGGAGRLRPVRAVGARRRPRRPTRSSRPAARSPTTTPSAPTTRRGCRTRSARSGTTCCACSRSAATRPG